MKNFLTLSFIIFCFSCTHKTTGGLVDTSGHPVAESKPEKDRFAKMDGCFLLYNVKTETFDKVIGEERCKQRFPACSTFKVALALMAFDSGALKDENTVLKWDHEKRKISSWNHDHNAKSWMKESVVWFSQRLTPKIGIDQVQKYLLDFNYGNQDMSAGLTEAWLVPPDPEKPALKISAYEQVEFMKNFWMGRLNVSPRAVQLTKDITYLETTPKGFRLNGKTGSSFSPQDRQIRFGWFIGHLEKDNQEYIVATNFTDLLPSKDSTYGGAVAKEITKKILADQGLW